MVEIRNPYPTFLINLESRPDRLVRANIEASKISAKVTLIVAVDGLANTERNSGLLTNSQQACFDSHRLAYLEFLRTNDSHALILEDDIEIVNKERFLRKLTLSEIKDFDLIQIGFLHMNLRYRIDTKVLHLENWIFMILWKVFSKNSFLSKRFENRKRVARHRNSIKGFIKDDFRAGAHCYLISRELAEFVLSLKEPFYYPIDGILSLIPHTNRFRVIRTTKSLAKQSNSPSSIKNIY